MFRRVLIFNIFMIDVNYIVTIFEGPFDAFLFRNSIALSGVHKQLPVNIDQCRFFLDNDETGKKVAMQKIKDDESVFLWKKFLQEKEIKKDIKDLNELVCYYYKHDMEFKYFELEKYFSSSRLDIIYV